jgi:hypothetical protein
MSDIDNIVVWYTFLLIMCTLSLTFSRVKRFRIHKNLKLYKNLTRKTVIFFLSHWNLLTYLIFFFQKKITLIKYLEFVWKIRLRIISNHHRVLFDVDFRTQEPTQLSLSYALYVPTTRIKSIHESHLWYTSSRYV